MEDTGDMVIRMTQLVPIAAEIKSVLVFIIHSWFHMLVVNVRIDEWSMEMVIGSNTGHPGDRGNNNDMRECPCSSNIAANTNQYITQITQIS